MAFIGTIIDRCYQFSFTVICNNDLEVLSCCCCGIIRYACNRSRLCYLILIGSRSGKCDGAEGFCSAVCCRVLHFRISCRHRCALCYGFKLEGVFLRDVRRCQSLFKTQRLMYGRCCGNVFIRVRVREGQRCVHLGICRCRHRSVSVIDYTHGHGLACCCCRIVRHACNGSGLCYCVSISSRCRVLERSEGCRISRVADGSCHCLSCRSAIVCSNIDRIAPCCRSGRIVRFVKDLLDREGCLCRLYIIGVCKYQILAIIHCGGHGSVTVIYDIDHHGLGCCRIICHAVSGSGLCHCVGIITRFCIGDLAELNRTAGRIRVGIACDLWHRDPFCCCQGEGELIGNITRLQPFRILQHLNDRDLCRSFSNLIFICKGYFFSAVDGCCHGSIAVIHDNDCYGLFCCAYR